MNTAIEFIVGSPLIFILAGIGALTVVFLPILGLVVLIQHLNKYKDYE